MRHPIRRSAQAAVAVATLSLAAACGGGFDDSAEQQDSGSASLTMLIASSGDAETQAVQAQVDAYEQESGNTVDLQVAADLSQELAQGFAGGNPPDVFYLDASRLADQADAGNLYPYLDQVDDLDDFYPNLVDAFTYDGTQYCLPKDFSTLALEINDAAWSAAGLTEADYPTTWEELSTVAQTLTTGGQTGLVIGDTRDRVGAFMTQAGGWFLNEDGSEVTTDSPENLEALQYVQENLAAGSFAYPSAVDAGWGGEAFGTGKAAMTIEGNWLVGAMEADYPDVGYTVVPLPEGPGGAGTLSFTNCLAVAADSDAQDAAVDLATYLTSADAMTALTQDTGVLPSRQSLADAYLEQFPERQAYVDGAEFAQGPVNAPGVEQVLIDFDSQLGGLATGDPQAILESTQTNLEQAIVG
ncbi:extracellular solute-binding protein [Geodermatophilaceae bacterium NBWT11]|nr:extracellular solute-binding protein [Geodermatophilaceae bacterium NBWT11]